MKLTKTTNILYTAATVDGCYITVIRERNQVFKRYYYHVLREIGEGNNYQYYRRSNESGAWRIVDSILKGVEMQRCKRCNRAYRINELIPVREYVGLGLKKYHHLTWYVCEKCIKPNDYK